MKRIYRDGVDVQVAFKSSVKLPADTLDSIEPSQPVVAQEPSQPVAAKNSYMKALLRRPLRRLKRIALWGLRPIVQPFFLELREDLVGHLQQVIEQIEQSNRRVADHYGHLVGQLQRHLVGQLQQDAERIKQLQQDIERIKQSSRRVAVYCGTEEVLVRTEVGYVFCSPSDHAVLACLMESGDLERGTRQLIQTFLGPGDTFIDVGAHLGMHTIAAARAMKGRGRVIAFEPFEPTQRLLSKSVELNGFSGMVEIHRTALSKHGGRQPLFLGNRSGHHSLFPLSSPPGESTSTVEVPVARLDELITGPIEIDLIKIDAEGAELEILEGARAIIEGSREIALIVEFGPSHLTRLGHTTQDWLSRFERLGLRYRVINSDTGNLEHWTEDQLGRVESINLFFARPGSHAWERATPTV